LKDEIKTTKERLENDLERLSDLKTKQEQQKGLLLAEQESKQNLVQSLSRKEKQLQKN